MPTVLLWFRRDLRLSDHPAFLAAVEAADGGRVLPVFVLDPALLDGAAGTLPRRHALAQALAGLRDACDGALVVRRGRPEQVVPALVEESGAASVHVSAESTPFGRARDARVEKALAVPLVATGSPYAVGPGLLQTGGGTPFQVFTPFSRAWRDHGWPAPADKPDEVRWYRQADSDGVPSVPDLPEGVELPEVNEAAAHASWARFRDEALLGYAEDRDRPDLDGTSRMSVHLKYGTIHPRTLLADLKGRTGKGATSYITELAWREFYADVLWREPSSAWSDLKPALKGMEYDDPSHTGVAADLEAWQQGRTGFPIVDAGMRQLVSTGWMHNRVRMITASFFSKHLHLWWPIGARYFLDHLVDGDIASNNHGWQWVAGTGTDASPYFRVFNPLTQGKKFDPDGDYVRQYVPELRHLSGARAHEPWESEDGYAEGYPERILDLKAEREEALRRYQQARS